MQKPIHDIKAVLFDLDGTLLDTASDLAETVNTVLQKYNHAPIPFSQLRSNIGQGLGALLKMSLQEDHPQFTQMLSECFTHYGSHSTQATRLFPGMEKVLAHLNKQKLPWGIVTNKPTHLTKDILEHFKIDQQAACVVCGDTLSKSKPDPAPILHACQLLKYSPANCLYVGDTQIDVLASKRAGTPILVALYGYLGPAATPLTWQADGYIEQPEEIISWIA